MQMQEKFCVLAQYYLCFFVVMFLWFVMAVDASLRAARTYIESAFCLVMVRL